MKRASLQGFPMMFSRIYRFFSTREQRGIRGGSSTCALPFGAQGKCFACQDCLSAGLNGCPPGQTCHDTYNNYGKHGTCSIDGTLRECVPCAGCPNAVGTADGCREGYICADTSNGTPNNRVDNTCALPFGATGKCFACRNCLSAGLNGCPPGQTCHDTYNNYGKHGTCSIDGTLRECVPCAGCPNAAGTADGCRDGYICADPNGGTTSNNKNNRGNTCALPFGDEGKCFACRDCLSAGLNGCPPGYECHDTRNNFGSSGTCSLNKMLAECVQCPDCPHAAGTLDGCKAGYVCAN